jgi:hypothetical protein
MSKVIFMFEEDSDTNVSVNNKFFGKYPGEVLENTLPKESETKGDLCVQVSSLFEDHPDEKGQRRPLKVVAKPNFLPGFFFIPEVGDRVWVEFVAGDINCPIWTGVWYPKESAPKTLDGEEPSYSQSVIRTASGHVIQLDDTEGDEKIVISHKGEAKIEIDKDGSLLLVNGDKKSFVYMNAKDGETTLADEHKNMITLTENGVLIGSDGNFVEMKKDGVTISTDGEVRIQSAKNIYLGGGTGAQYESLLFGDMFAKVFDTHIHAHPFGPTGPPIPMPSKIFLPKSPFLSQLVKVITK